MQRFDICQIRRISGMTHAVCLQSEFYDFLPTRLVAPLWLEAPGDFIERITPRLVFRDQDWLVRLDMAVGLSASSIGPVEGSAMEIADNITSALDRLMTGF